MEETNFSMQKTYSEMVEALSKPGGHIIMEMTPKKAHCWHMATGISGESGELLDAIKKWVLYRKPLDVQNVIEELGDIEFYLEGLRNSLGLTRHNILKANMEKLLVRYSDGEYSDYAAINRKDKGI